MELKLTKDEVIAVRDMIDGAGAYADLLDLRDRLGGVVKLSVHEAIALTHLIDASREGEGPGDDLHPLRTRLDDIITEHYEADDSDLDGPDDEGGLH
jgi:hypothetical protein